MGGLSDLTAWFKSSLSLLAQFGPMKQMLAITLQPFSSSRKGVVFFTASMVGLTLVLLVGFTLGFLIPHGAVDPYDKLVHGMFFATFLFFAGTAIRDIALFPVLGVVVLAVGSEIIQGMVPGRVVSIEDIYANGGGCLLGLLMLRFKAAYIALIDNLPFLRS